MFSRMVFTCKYTMSMFATKMGFATSPPNKWVLARNIGLIPQTQRFKNGMELETWNSTPRKTGIEAKANRLEQARLTQLLTIDMGTGSTYIRV